MATAKNSLHVNDDYLSFNENDTISGNVLANDVAGNNGQKYLRFFDGDGVLAKKAGQVTDIHGQYGTFHVKADGSFTYELDPDVKAGLGAGQTLQETIQYKISDGSGNTDVGFLKLDIHGQTEAPPPQEAGNLVLDFEDVTEWEYHDIDNSNYHGFNFTDGSNMAKPNEIIAISDVAYSYDGLNMDGDAGHYAAVNNYVNEAFSFTRVDGSDFDFLGANLSDAEHLAGKLHIVAFDDGKLVYDNTISVDGSYQYLDIRHVDHVTISNVDGAYVGVDNMHFNVAPLA